MDLPLKRFKACNVISRSMKRWELGGNKVEPKRLLSCVMRGYFDYLHPGVLWFYPNNKTFEALDNCDVMWARWASIYLPLPLEQAIIAYTHMFPPIRKSLTLWMYILWYSWIASNIVPFLKWACDNKIGSQMTNDLGMGRDPPWKPQELRKLLKLPERWSCALMRENLKDGDSLVFIFDTNIYFVTYCMDDLAAYARTCAKTMQIDISRINEVTSECFHLPTIAQGGLEEALDLFKKAFQVKDAFDLVTYPVSARKRRDKKNKKMRKSSSCEWGYSNLADNPPV